jgi:hypothetical protein
MGAASIAWGRDRLPPAPVLALEYGEHGLDLDAGIVRCGIDRG